MPKLKNRMPKMCRDGKKAISWHNRKRVYHGAWGSPAAEKSYKRFIADLLESPTLPLRMDRESDVLVAIAQRKPYCRFSLIIITVFV